MTNYQSWHNFEPKNHTLDQETDDFWQPEAEAKDSSEANILNARQLQLYTLNENGEPCESLNVLAQAPLQISQPFKPKFSKNHFEGYKEEPAPESCLKRRYVRVSSKRVNKTKNQTRVAISRILVSLLIILNCFSLYQQSELKHSLKKQEAVLMNISGQINKLSNLYKNLSENQKNFFGITASKIEARLNAFQNRLRAPKNQIFPAHFKRKAQVGLKKNTHKFANENTQVIAINTPSITSEKPENTPKPAFEKAEQAQETFEVIRASSEPTPSNNYSYDELFMKNVPVARE